MKVPNTGPLLHTLSRLRVLLQSPGCAGAAPMYVHSHACPHKPHVPDPPAHKPVRNARQHPNLRVSPGCCVMAIIEPTAVAPAMLQLNTSTFQKLLLQTRPSSTATLGF